MGYHSADYDQDWKIGVAELSRVTFLYNTTFEGVRTGCYKVDSTSIDGFAQDTNRAIDDPVTLTQYHSADYNQDGRIDDNEVARVAELYGYRYQDIPLGGYTRTGEYHDGDPQSIDGFGLGPVSLSDYNFDSDHKPTINTKIVPDGTYVLRAKFIDRSSTGFQAAVSLNNNGLVLDELPPPGVYNVELYWVKYAVNGFEGDYDNDGVVTQADVDAIGDIAAGLLPQPTGSQFMRADCAPRSTLGDGDPIDGGDWVQAGRYKNLTDAIREVGGPGTPDNPPTYVIWQIGDVSKVVVTVSANKEHCLKSQAKCVCGDLDVVEDNPDKGQCFPYRVKPSCNAPDTPIPECQDTEAYVVSTPGTVPPFYVVSRLFDSLCDPITDQDYKDILTIIK